MNVTLTLDMGYMKVKLQRGGAKAHNAIFFFFWISATIGFYFEMKKITFTKLLSIIRRNLSLHNIEYSHDLNNVLAVIALKAWRFTSKFLFIFYFGLYIFTTWTFSLTTIKF